MGCDRKLNDRQTPLFLAAAWDMDSIPLCRKVAAL